MNMNGEKKYLIIITFIIITSCIITSAKAKATTIGQAGQPKIGIEQIGTNIDTYTPIWPPTYT